MADAAALINATDRFVLGAGTLLVIPLVSLRGITNEGLNAGGTVTIDLTSGSVVSEARLLPPGASFELWLIDNRPAASHTTLADQHDVSLKVAGYVAQSQPGVYSLSTSLGGPAFADFFPDRAFVARSGQTPSGSFVLTGSSNLFDRLARRQVRFVDDPSAATGFDPLAPSTRSASFARLIAQGRHLFLKETFAGNGRTCGTCHVESNNFTIDPRFIASVPASDPLFVAETNASLAQLENSALLRSFGLIGVNGDGFDKPLLFRATQNVQALGNSTVRPNPVLAGDFSGNGLNPDPPERLGWGNDGAPLRDFSIVAVVQHAPKTLARARGVDFRVPTDEELDALAAYQLALGRQEDFNLSSLELRSAVASQGKSLFLDSGGFRQMGHKNCNACHFNAGATGAFAGAPGQPGFPRLGVTPHGGNIVAPLNVHLTPVGIALGLPRDGGFGALSLPSGGFGNFGTTAGQGIFPAEEFATPALVEAADTGPSFHNHSVAALEDAVAFYGSAAFQSPGSIGNVAIPITISSDPKDPEVQAISLFLRVLNALENIRAAINVAGRARQTSNLADAQELAGLARAEVDDAIEVLCAGAAEHAMENSIVSSRDHLSAARALLNAAGGPVAGAGVTNMIGQAADKLRAARLALANPATLPASFRN
jgi:cytochrome c peroxidase